MSQVFHSISPASYSALLTYVIHSCSCTMSPYFARYANWLCKAEAFHHTFKGRREECRTSLLPLKNTLLYKLIHILSWFDSFVVQFVVVGWDGQFFLRVARTVKLTKDQSNDSKAPKRRDEALKFSSCPTPMLVVVAIVFSSSYAISLMFTLMV